jgi:hypothetical protein
MSSDKFVAVYCDLTIAQDTVKPEQFAKAKSDILKKYDVNEAQLKATYDYYYQNPKLWEEFFKNALERMDKLNKHKPI